MTHSKVTRGLNIGFILLVVLSVYLGATNLLKQPTTNNSVPVVTYLLEPYEATVNEARIIEVISGHAWQSHGIEVNETIKCLEKNGTWKSFRTSGFFEDGGRNVNTNLWICKEKDKEKYYVLVTSKFVREGVNQVARLVTAYKISKDVFPSIQDFINYIVTKWGATEINYVIEAGQQFFLSVK